MSDASTGGTPAGWYEDGVTAGQERYWDGTQWTDQFRPLAPAAPVVEPTPAAAPAAAPTAYPPYQPATGAAPAAAPAAAAAAYPAYQPASAAAPGAPRKGLSKGALIGIIVAAVVVVAAIVVVIIGASTNWFQGGGASSAQQSQFLQHVKASGASGASDQDLLKAGNSLCDAGRMMIGGDYFGGATKAMELYSSNLDLMTLGYVSQYAMSDLCPDVAAKLAELGESVTP
ncbi:MAG: hypothetical protein BGO95_02530 [Micrococcales bacterium 73-13]|nr:MAG: hypothetical protein BGO95_02530 [Micrococcales bacterium 73-13]